MPNELAGAKELTQKLSQLERRLAIKILRSAALRSTTPVVRAMKQRVPVGKEAHKSYKGRILVPGFLSRSIRRQSRVRGAKVSVAIGVRKEAFYGVSFLDDGVSVRQRRRPNGRVLPVKPYRIGARKWFARTFEQNIGTIQREMIKLLRQQIDKVTRG